MTQDTHIWIPRLLLLLLWRTSTAFHPGTGLRPTRIASKPQSPIFVTRHGCSTRRVATRLQGTRNNSTSDPNEIITNDESAFLTGDLVAVVLACQLIGLVDAINDVSFLEHGGWAQPFPTVPSTLGVFVQRTCTGCMTWVAASLLTTTSRIPNKNTTSTSPRTIRIMATARVVLLFISLQLGLAFGISLADSGGTSFHPIVVSRDCYFILIVLLGWRYLHAQLMS